MCRAAFRVVTSITATQSLWGSTGVSPEKGSPAQKSVAMGKGALNGQASGASRSLKLPQGLSGSSVTLDDE